MTTGEKQQFDVGIVGGSFAGMSAALQLARAHRPVVVFDAGKRRNRFAEKSYGYLSRDGESPDEIARIAREQLLTYPTVTWRESVIDSITGEEGDFVLKDESGDEVQARLIILATGAEDQLPDIEGVRERWGTAVFTCPYCHGYELEKGRIAVIATDEGSVEQAMMLLEWGEVTLFTNQVFEMDDVQERALDIKNVSTEASAIERISGEATIELEDGKSLDFDGIALAPTGLISELPEQLGCEIEEGAHGPLVKVDQKQLTTVEGVYACGDVAKAIHNVTFAVADGSLAGTAVHSQLMQTD